VAAHIRRVSRGERQQGRARRRVRRRTRAPAADGRLHAAGEGSDSPRLGTAPGGSERPDDRPGAGVKTIQQKLDRLDEAFLFAQTIDGKSYERQRDRLREELTLAQIDHHTEAVDELDVQGILAFAERILPRASDLWVQASLDYKQRLQQLFFPEGIAYDGNRFNRTAATAPLFNYLAPSESADEKMVSRIFASWNQLDGWLQAVDSLRRVA
jgi:hypothetical protein